MANDKIFFFAERLSIFSEGLRESRGRGKARDKTRVFLSHHEDYQSSLKGCERVLRALPCRCGRLAQVVQRNQQICQGNQGAWQYMLLKCGEMLKNKNFGFKTTIDHKEVKKSYH